MVSRAKTRRPTCFPKCGKLIYTAGVLKVNTKVFCSVVTYRCCAVWMVWDLPVCLGNQVLVICQMPMKDIRVWIVYINSANSWLGIVISGNEIICLQYLCTTLNCIFLRYNSHITRLVMGGCDWQLDLYLHPSNFVIYLGKVCLCSHVYKFQNQSFNHRT